MGNNMGGGCGKAAKVMKINGEYFKLKTPAKVIDIIKDYPDHVLMDSKDFERYNLRANPLSLEDELKPKRIYLLFEPPKFPNDKNMHERSPLRRVRSGVGESTIPRELMLKARRSISARSTATVSTDSDDGGGSPGVGPSRVRIMLPKAQVEKIVKESSGDDVEITRKILKLLVAKGGDVVAHVALERGEARDDVVFEQEDEVVEVERH